MEILFCEQALLPEGWARDVRLDITAEGDIRRVHVDSAPGDLPRAAGPVIPGMANLHSHAFQRAMAGLAERGRPGEESFWTWREVMYGFVEKLAPEDVGAIAAELYVEMLKAGYTAVAEFHYLHHQPGGEPYARPEELSERVIEAALRAGIGITHLPVLYTQGGFGGEPPGPPQARFTSEVEGLLSIVDALAACYADDPRVRIGLALHSLRAVGPEALQAAVEAQASRDAEAPVHIHVAEQEREVADCLAWSGARPVDWLLDHAPVDPRWCLVHATHVSADEIRRLAASGAVAGLCPTTEANLGDGIFPARDYLEAGGVIGIGSDSHVSVSPAEELRWLEYGQRLAHRRRAVLGGAEGGHVGAVLYRAALAGGARASGRPIGSIAAGFRADLVVLDGEHPILAGSAGETLLDAYVFAGSTSPVRDVMVGGRWVVREGRHAREAETLAAYRAARARLAA